MKLPRLPGLQVRVYLYGILLLVASIGFGAYGVSYVIRHVFAERIDDASLWLTDRLVADRDHPEKLAAELREFTARTHSGITLYDPEGRVVVSTVEPPLARPPANAPRRGRAVDTGSIFRVAVEYGEPGRPQGLLVLERMDVFPFGALVLFLGGALFFVVVIGYPLARSVLRPVRGLRDAAERVGRGDLRARAPVTGSSDELDALAQSFNEMAARIEALRKAEHELLANVSHELRTPLARIRVALELASEEEPDVARSYIAEIAADLGEVEALLGDVLTTARLELASEADALPTLAHVRLRLGEVVERAAKRFRALHPHRELAIDLADGADEVPLEVDPVLVQRAVQNLLDNAAKYSKEGIRLAARTEAGESVVEIEDRGQGLTEEELAQVFRPFYRGDKSRTRGTGGVGLGLALAKKIAEAHGGTLALRSRSGEGTTVELRLPVASG